MCLDFFFFFFKGNIIRPYFAFCAVVDGVCYKTGLGKNKKESRLNAAKLALDELLNLEYTGVKASEKSGKYSGNTYLEFEKLGLKVSYAKSQCSFIKCFRIRASVDFLESFGQSKLVFSFVF